LGGCRKGFAICTSGIYYCESKIGYLSWNDFKNVNVSYGFLGLKIGDELFNATGDGNKLLIILKSLKENL